MGDIVDRSECSALADLPTSEARTFNRATPPKSARVVKLLQRGKGATLLELQEETEWQPQSVRAFLSGLRKKGTVLLKEQRKSGDTAYRLVIGKIAAADV